MMYRRMFVPVDGSPASNLGLRHALGLAKDQGARVRFLNVIDDMLIAPMADGFAVADTTMLFDSLRASGAKALDQGARLAKSANVRADTVLVESKGRPVSDVILEQADEFGADVIVMGTHGRRGLNRLLLGSDAERVLRDAHTPVLLVRDSGESGRAGKRARKRPAPKRAARATKTSSKSAAAPRRGRSSAARG
jgi:nucleotide-binding universal stress UspA family protein